MKNTFKVLIILGQTATGKSDFAVEIAKKINGEIISADSRQVYKRMNLGTGKITKKEMRGVPHHLLDITSPKKVFSVDDFQKRSSRKINEILKRSKIPIICGGTGFYIDTLINETSLPKVPPNKKLRKELSQKPTEELFQILKKLDNNRSENIDKNNPVRLIRAIEIAQALGRVPVLTQNIKNGSSKNKPRNKTIKNNNTSTNSAMAEFVEVGQNSKFKVLKIGLNLPPEILKERICTRLLSRIKKGMIKEVEDLHKEGVSWKRLEELGLEYRYVSMYLQKKLSKEEMLEKLNTKIWQYAKRQKTWWKRDQNIIWINPKEKLDKKKVMKRVKEFLG